MYASGLLNPYPFHEHPSTGAVPDLLGVPANVRGTGVRNRQLDVRQCQVMSGHVERWCQAAPSRCPALDLSGPVADPSFSMGRGHHSHDEDRGWVTSLYPSILRLSLITRTPLKLSHIDKSLFTGPCEMLRKYLPLPTGRPL